MKRGALIMEKAKKLTSAEIAMLPLGAVVWRESHTIMDCGEYGKIDGYHVFPMLICEPGERGAMGYIDRDSEIVIEINNIPEDEIYWNKEPETEQIKSGIPIDEAFEIFNKYEKEVFALT